MIATFSDLDNFSWTVCYKHAQQRIAKTRLQQSLITMTYLGSGNIIAFTNIWYVVDKGETGGDVPPGRALPQLCLKHKEHQRHQPDNAWVA